MKPPTKTSTFLVTFGLSYSIGYLYQWLVEPRLYDLVLSDNYYIPLVIGNLFVAFLSMAVTVWIYDSLHSFRLRTYTMSKNAADAAMVVKRQQFWRITMLLSAAGFTVSTLYLFNNWF